MTSVRRISRAARRALATGALAGALGCSHAQPTPAPAEAQTALAAPSEPDLQKQAEEIASEAHDLFRVEGDLLWQRWTTGGGAAPSSAAAGHEKLYEKSTLDLLARAEAKSDDAGEKQAISLLLASLAPQAIAKGSNGAALALEQTRAQLAFAAPGDVKPEHSERDLDRLLTDEPNQQKRIAIADAEATAAAPLAALAIARDEKEEQTRAQLGLPAWSELITSIYGRTPDQLAQLAEEVLTSTQDLATRAISSASQRNLGQPLDQLHRADLPRVVRATEADAELAAGRTWENTRAVFAGLGLDPLALPAGSGTLRVDAEPAPTKASRPLALLVDPPSDVRLSLKSTGGFDEQRAMLHETARALGGALTRTAHWENAQLGDGSAAEAIAWLAESLSGDPIWLRERTGLRGEPLDDLVHTEATRRLLAVRRAAALVLFEVQRRAGPQTAEAENALYRSLLTRATLAQHGDREGARWPLEVDGWMHAAVSLRAALLGASLALGFEAKNAAQPQSASATSPIPAGAQLVAAATVATPTIGTASTSNGASNPADAPASTTEENPTPPSPSRTGTLGSPESAAAAPSSSAPTAPSAAGTTVAADRSAAPAAPSSATPASPATPALPGASAASSTTAAWWRSPADSEALRKLWSQGRALTAEAAAEQAGLLLNPTSLARLFEERLAYQAPEKPPAAQRPDYKFMQGDRRARRRKHKKKAR